MPQEQSHITCHCGHQQVRAVESENKTITSKLKLLMHPKRRHVAPLCSICEAKNRRHAPPAKGTTETLAALALGGRGDSLPALRAVQIRWATMANITKSKKVITGNEFSDRDRLTAAEAERELEKIDNFWKQTHSDHVANISASDSSPGESGPDDCLLCEAVLYAFMERPHQPGQPDCDCQRCNRIAVNQALSRNGSESGQGYARIHSENRLSQIRRKITKRSLYSMAVDEELSTIMEEESDQISDLVPILPGSPVSQTDSDQSDQSEISYNKYQETPQDDALPLVRKNNNPDLPCFSLSENTLWRPKPPVPLQRINPDSVEGSATIQRIRNFLDFPNATPLQILSIRALPEERTDVEDLLSFEKDVLSVAWKQADEEGAKGVKRAKLDPESFDGKYTMLRIKRHLELADSATIGDILSVPKLPDALANSNNLNSFAADVDSIAWKDEDELQAKKLVEMATVNPVATPLPLSPPFHNESFVEMKEDANQETDDLIFFES